jgi:nicotinate-nucleotide--dimethylbenzimidazole phosphoribosyltransferase
MSLLDKTMEKIVPVDHGYKAAVRAHLDNLTKPVGSLGYLEEIATDYCLAAHTSDPHMGGKIIFTFAGDHGVADEGVSAFPKEVTFQMVRNMLGGGAAVNVLASWAGIELRVVDIGVGAPMKDVQGLIERNIRQGTANIAEGPAMSLEEAKRAIEVGIELADEAVNKGATLIGTGEMGIANTSVSSALFAALLPCEVKGVTGRGTGIDDAVIKHKVSVIERALRVNKESLTDPLNTIAAVGGLEIAGICGLILGPVSRHVPVVVDGFSSSAGALVACEMCSYVREYLFYSHLSAEKGHSVFFKHYRIRPILDFRMCLGEGTGAALAMSLIEAAVRIYNEMATFDSAGISKKGD